MLHIHDHNRPRPVVLSSSPTGASNPFDGTRTPTFPSQAKRLGAVMLTCGFYDESGDFAFRVASPGKSGVWAAA